MYWRFRLKLDRNHPGWEGGGKKYSSTVYQKILAVSGYQQRLPEESLLLHTRTTQRIQYYSVEGEVLNLNILLLIEIYWISHK